MHNWQRGQYSMRQHHRIGMGDSLTTVENHLRQRPHKLLSPMLPLSSSFYLCKMNMNNKT